MRKIFGVMILLAMLIVGGCTGSSMKISSTDDEITISATNANEDGGNGSIKIPEGSTLQGDAKISAGKLIMVIGGKEHIVDKTGEFFIDVPGGKCDLLFTAEDGLTGEIILRALPEI